MSWRVFATAASDDDFARLSESERSALNDDLFAWVDDGPPLGNRRVVFDVEMFEDLVPSGYRVTYVVNRAEPYVAILRVRHG